MTTTSDMIKRQEPMSTPFGYRTAAAEVLAGHDLEGSSVIVTGGYSGLGLETVKALADAGVNVTVPARRPEAAQAALKGIAGVTVRPMDLSDLESVAAFTATRRGDGTPLAMIINAAGVKVSPEARTPQGWESQFGTNHLGHFALVGGIADLLSEGSRVVSYSSVAHYRSPVLFDDINFETNAYDPWIAYGQSKTAAALFAVGLDARGAYRNIHSFSVPPGGIMTDLQRHMPREELLKRQWIDADGNVNPLFKTPAEGAATDLWAATAPEIAPRGGVYCEDSSIKGIVPPEHADASTGGVKQWAIEADLAERLWDISVAATGVNPLGSR